MKVSVQSAEATELRVDVVAVPLAAQREGARVPARLTALDRALGGRIGAVLGSRDFRGKRDESLLLYPDGNAGPRRVLLLGLGDEARVDADALRRAAGVLVGAARARGARTAGLLVPALRRVRPPAAAQALAEGAVLAAYRFDAYRSNNGRDGNDAEPPAPETLALVPVRGADARGMRRPAADGVIIGESQNLARRLSNEPPNALPPAALAREAEKLAKEVGLACRVLEVPELRRRKMGGILAVGQGSANPPRLVVLEHNAPGRRRGARRPTLCFVGKGITFDSGGISIKPSAQMDEMKHDMSGAAAVVGALRAAALLRIPLHVVGVIGAAENLPSGTAYRPGDIVTTMAGKTIEVLNTDAEGRIVLSDALHFACSEFEPAAIVDLATLTGACVISLGSHASGLMGNDERWIERVRAAGEATAERVWPLPLWEPYGEQVKSKVADIKNTGGREAGTITAAAFLRHFVDDTPWAHLDIAGTAWTSKPGPYQPFGATGVGVRLLVELMRGFRGRRARLD